MITQRVSVIAEALFNAASSLATGEDECVLYREDMEALLDHIGDLEFELHRASGTIAINALHEAFERRAD